MGIKKSYKKLAMASACALALGWAVNVQAGTFVNSGTAGAAGGIATEIFGTGSDATPLPTTATATATYTMVSTPGAGAAFNIEYTLGNGATWGTALTAGSCLYTDTDTGGNLCSVNLVEGGGLTGSTATRP